MCDLRDGDRSPAFASRSCYATKIRPAIGSWPVPKASVAGSLAHTDAGCPCAHPSAPVVVPLMGRSAGPGLLRSDFGELRLGQWPQYAELVAVRVGHHHPTDVRALPDVGSAGTQQLQPSHFGILIPRAQVKV